MSGVIEGTEEVQFTETGARPDTLEQTVVGAAETSAAVAPSGAISCGDKVWEAYKNLCSTFSYNPRPPQEEGYKEVVVNFLQMEYLKQGSQGWRAFFQLGQLSPENFLTCIENIYGDVFKGTDIEDKIRAETQSGVLPPEITALFPELAALSQLQPEGYWLGELYGNERKVTLVNPYLLVLCASPQYKPVIAGCIELAEKNQAFAGIDFNQNIDVATATHGKEKLTKYIGQYAKQVGQKNVIPFLQELNRIPVKERG